MLVASFLALPLKTTAAGSSADFAADHPDLLAGFLAIHVLVCAHQWLARKPKRLLAAVGRMSIHIGAP
jgi:hypothetical protein